MPGRPLWYKERKAPRLRRCLKPQPGRSCAKGMTHTMNVDRSWWSTILLSTPTLPGVARWLASGDAPSGTCAHSATATASLITHSGPARDSAAGAGSPSEIQVPQPARGVSFWQVVQRRLNVNQHRIRTLSRLPLRTCYREWIRSVGGVIIDADRTRRISILCH